MLYPTQRMDVCVCVYSVFVMCFVCVCVWVTALPRADPHPRSPTACVKIITKLKKGPGPNKEL
jgi:hypothetical protein